MQKIKHILLFLVFYNVVPAVDMLQVYNASLRYNSEYLQAIASGNAGAQAVPIALANVLPQISATASFSEIYYSFDNAVSGNSSNLHGNYLYRQPSYSIQSTQVIFDWSKFSQIVKASNAKQVGLLQVDNAKQNLAKNAVKVYLDILQAMDNIILLNDKKLATLSQLKQVSRQYDLGAATIVDLNDVNFADNSIDANLIKATNTLSEEQNLLYNMSGISQYNIQPIVESIDLHSIVPDNIDYWLKLSQHNNIDIKIAIEQVKMTTADISIAISGHLPTINMNANMQYQDVSNVDNYGGSVSLSQLEYPGGPLSTQSTSSVGVAASLPIFSGGGVHAKTVSAKYTKEATEQQLVTTKRKVEMDVRNSYNKINSMIKMTIAQNKSLQSAKMKLASDKRGYEIGIRTIVDVLNSQNNYYTAWYEYNKSRYELLQARTDLAFLTGQINLDYIKYLNSQITIESTL